MVVLLCFVFVDLRQKACVVGCCLVVIYELDGCVCGACVYLLG